MEEMREKIEQKAREDAQDELINYMLGLIARVDDRHEFVD